MRRIPSTHIAGALAAVALTVAIAAALGSAGTHADSAHDRAAAAQPTVGTYTDLVAAADDGTVTSVVVDPSTWQAEVVYTNGRVQDVVVPPDNGQLLRGLAADGVDVTVEQPPVPASDGSGGLIVALVPVIVLLAAAILMAAYMRRRARNGAIGPDTSLRRSAQLVEVPRERFGDVAGVDEAVEELAEVVEFYSDPERFHRLGAKLPSGILLHGDPGTGKTLLARALAGEAGIPFYAISGSDFVEKFVGVGASRVRELFARARSHPEGAVIFIDEIDAVGRARGGGGGDAGEREQTLNQILVEMDGFSTDDRVICVAATNRLDVLDPALLRPGRFGRHIAVQLPSAAGREAILAVHAAGRPLADDVDLRRLAERTHGLSGAQLAELVNEGAIMAGRCGALRIAAEHLREAYLRVLAGPKRRGAPLAPGELEVIAAHEAGHVLTAECGERYEKAQQVTIEPRGRAMGLAVYGQTDRALHDPEYLHEALVATLGGRAAEQVVFGRISSGAANDLQKATELARQAVEELGFSPRLGQIVAGRSPFSEATRAVVESEVERMVAEAYADALDVLGANRAQLDALRRRLVQQRELERVDIISALGTVTRRAGRRVRGGGDAVPIARPRAVPVTRGEVASEAA